MADPDRYEALLAAAHERHVDARRRTVAALRRLDSSGGPISFAAVAEAAGVSRGFLYRQIDLRAEIENLRLSPNHKDRRSRPLRERATAESLRQELEALRIREAELRAENRWLKEAVARKLGQDRADSAR
jgi:predicted nicotinamide N-methyase